MSLNIMRHLLTLLLFIYCSIFSAQETITYSFTGQVETYVVPACVSQLEITVQGAKGGGPNGGNGSTVTGILEVVEGQILEIRVGGMGLCPDGGYNGGGIGGTASEISNYACGGGGASDIRVAPFGLNDRIIVAAGGGGTGGGDTDAIGGNSGCGNGANGDSPYGQGGFGASITTVGAGGPPWIDSGNTGENGSLGLGGNGADDPCYNMGPGGGGGGGYYGGGGGGSDCFSSYPLGGGGGGGGSSFVPNGFSCTSGNVSSNGMITISNNEGITLEASPVSPSFCQGDSILMILTGADSYSWSPDININPIDTSEFWITVDSSTVYTIIGSNDECSDSIDIQVDVQSVFDIQNIVELCPGETFILPDGSEVTSAGVYPVVFETISNQCDSIITTEIFVIDSNIVELDENICDGEFFTLADGSTVDQPGTYSTVLSSLVNGCDSTIITDLSVHPSYYIELNDIVCDDGSYSLPDGTYPNASGVYDFSFISNFGCDSLVTIDLIFNPTHNIEYDVEICSGESYTLPDGLVVESSSEYVSSLQTSSGCDSIITVFLEVFDLPLLDTNLNESYCHDEGEIEISPQPPGGILSGDLLNGFILEHEGEEGGEYSLSYTYTDSNGCTNTINEEYILANVLYPDIIPNISCNTLNLQSTIDAGVNIFDWYLDDELVGVGAEWNVEFEEYGDYILSLNVTDAYGCNYNADTLITLNHVLDIEGFFVPNIITPNYDNINDELLLQDSFSSCVDFNIHIYNKWGTLVYEMTNDSEIFSGNRINNTELPDGVYYYTLEVPDYPCQQTPELKDWCYGTISLIRD
ncbi:MAG: hypothetical protein CL850_01715 [Crocinitomicaceae bacterium]|nr:hypothetical protein [Crocinitomicaceae bacterium]